jgi:hypothetical protein
MLASIPARILNLTRGRLGIPNRFNQPVKCSSLAKDRKVSGGKELCGFNNSSITKQRPTRYPALMRLKHGLNLCRDPIGLLSGQDQRRRDPDNVFVGFFGQESPRQ